MTTELFELKPEELRAVIGGATYYCSANRLPTLPTAEALAWPTLAAVGHDRPFAS